MQIKAVDLFCGAGGTSTGLANACTALGLDLDLIAINHWNVAIDTHSTNHADAKHLCQSIDNVDPRKVVPGGRLNLLVASPECIHHSNARGGRPMNEQSRASAWHILRWAEALYIENILIENVREFRTWGPLGANGRPILRLKGHLYIQFINSLRALGYNVEDRILNAADYGDPTTRERLFIMARRGKPISWPIPRYAPASRRDGTLFSTPKKQWRTAREIIDWSLPSQSIFSRKRPLAPKTLARIIAGLERFGGPNAEPFLVVLRNHAAAQSLDKPVPALCATGKHMGICEPFVLGQQSGGAPRSVEQPIPTVAGGGAISLIEPMILPQFGDASARSVDRPLGTVTTTSRGVGLIQPIIIGTGGPEGAAKPRPVDEPLKTVLCDNRLGVASFLLGHPRGNDETDKTAIDSVDKPLRTVTASSCDVGLVEPFIINIDQQSGGVSVRDVDSPVPTQTTKARTCLVEPFILPHQYGSENLPRSVDEPINTVTPSRDTGALVEPFIVPNFGEREGQGPRTHSVDAPVPAVTSHGAGALVEPFLCKFNGTVRPVNEPLDTVTTKDRFALVETDKGQFYVDIRFRMLQPNELARAQGFPDTYKFKGNREEIVRQIGNAVPVNLANALCASLLSDYKKKAKKTSRLEAIA